VSIGVASLKRDADTAEQLVATADQRMYLAKKRGKNQVCGDSAPARTHGPSGRRKPRED
jgi:diguanylate cyclase (GGDEF)-like protein